MEKGDQLRYCLYARKSSEQDERQAMSIESQTREMLAMAEQQGLNIVEIKHESHSAKQSAQRPMFNELIQGLRDDKYNALLTWAPDRLSRNAGDLGSLVDLMDQNKLQEIKTYSQNFTNSPNEKFLLMILCSQAKLENDNKSINVKRGIRTKCEMGWRPGVAPLGYMNRAFGGVNDIILDPDRAPLVKEAFEKAGYERWSGRRLKTWLDGQGFTNRSGKPISVSQILVILSTPFYYGRFQYPQAPDAPWYTGAHQPLVSKELYDLVQETRGINKGVWGSKTFAFRGLLKCGQCGADITAQDKFKTLKNGDTKRFVYYNCTRRKDPNCTEKYVNEERLCELMQGFIEQHHDQIKITDKLQAKVDRHFYTTKTLLKHYKIELKLDQPFIEYARYVLADGTDSERTTLAANMGPMLQIRNGELEFYER